MSDTPSDSLKSVPRRDESRREPATIDLSATEVREPPATSEEAVAAGPLPEPSDVSGPSGADVRPTPDEVIPSDDPQPPSADPDTSILSGGEGPPASSAGPGRYGFGSLLTAGIIGGLLGGGATLLADTLWRTRASGVDARLAQIEERVATAPQTPLGPLEGRLAKIETDTKGLAERLNTTQALAERGAKQAAEALSRPPASAPAGAESAAALADITARFSALEKQVQERAQTSAAAVERQVGAAQERAQAASATAQALERRIAEHDQRLAAVTKQVSERGADATAASLRVTLADRLGDSLREGTSAGQIIPMLRRLDVKPEALQAIEPYAQTRPPNAASLAREFRPIGERMIAETRPAAADWGERFWRMLDKVVTVRAIGDPASTNVASLVSRIEDALARGAIGEAAAAWDTLPDSARRVAPEWGAKLKQRAAAEAAAQTIYAEALSALAASTR